MIMFLIYLLFIFSNIYVLSKINNKKIFSIKNIINLIIISTGYMLSKSYNVNNHYIIIILYTYLFLFNIFFEDLSANKSFISVILLYITNAISEIIISLFLICLGINNINLIGHVLIAIVSILLINILNKKIYKIIIKNSKQFIIPILSIILIILYYTIIKNIFAKNSIFAINSILFSLIVISLLVKNIIEKQKINNLNKLYNESLSTILEYEKIIDVKTKMTHEYKNNLLLIKSMLSKEDKKVSSYIETLLKTSITKSDNKLLDQMTRIPFRTFSGMLYYKINQAEENNINVILDVNNNLKKLDRNIITEDDVKDICKITGIFMDNAIDANKDIEDKEISITMYANQEELVISIANKFNGITYNKNLKSTKGKWHGYGLKIAKDVIRKNKKIKNTTECISNVFIQNIIISIKNR